MKLHGLEVGMYKHASNTMEAAWDTFLKVADEFIAGNRLKYIWVTGSKMITLGIVIS